MGIFAFKSAKVEIWFQLECAPEQLVSVVTANRHFYVATFFSVVSELDYLLLEHVVFWDDLDFCLWEMLQQGALDGFFVVLILIGTRTVLVMKVSSGVNIFMRWVFNCCLFVWILLMVFACLMSNPGGGELSMT